MTTLYYHRGSQVFRSIAAACRNTSTSVVTDRKDKLNAESVTKRKKFADIPTARRLPLIGTKLDFVLAGAGKKLHIYIDGRHQALGPVFRETLGPADVVFVSCPSAMRELFKYEGKCPKHPLPESWTMYNEAHQCKRGLFFMDDDEWLQNRKIMNNLMLHADGQQPVRQVILQTCDEFVADWHTLLQQQGHRDATVEVPDLINALYAWSVRGVSAVVLGNIANGDRLRPLIDKLSGMLHMLFEDSAPLMSFPPALAKRFNMRIWSTFERTVTGILAVANDIAGVALEQLKAGADGGAGSLMNGMVQYGMPEDVIKRIFIDLILAAGDTTAYTTQWALYLLAHDQNAQQLVRNEIRQSQCNLESSLVRGTVRETMRLYPMAFCIGRLMPVDAIIAGFDIPKHTMVLASLYTAGRSIENFPAANYFQPWRWIRDSSGKYTGVNKPGASIPYALGARSCIGQKLANTQMHFLLSSILRDFELKLLNEHDVDVDIKMVMVPSEKVRIAVRRLEDRKDKINM